MSASTTNKKQCAKCDKGAGIFTCEGCEQAFCGKHVYEHRQELIIQLDNVMQEHDVIQQEFEQSTTKKSPLMIEIDQWENDAIAKIRAAAETARMDLQELFHQSKKQLVETCLNIKRDLLSSREADDYSEKDLLRWKEQLKQLRTEITTPTSAKLVRTRKDAIPVIKLTTNEVSNNQTASSDQPPPPPPPKSNPSPDTQERFLQMLGPVNVSSDNYLARHIGPQAGFAPIRGRFLYSQGRYTIRFRIERSAQPYHIFFGCMSSKGPLTDQAAKSPFTVGWFGYNQVYEHGRCTTNCQKYKYHSTEIEKNDELHLIIDCNKKEIRLSQQRKNTTCALSVNTDLAPFPWQFLMILCRPGDSVRILPSP